MTSMRSSTPPDLSRRIQKAGYYPDLVADTLSVALAGEEITAHLVHSETTFDMDTVRRHLSVLAITPTRLIFVHADDHADEPDDDDPLAGAVPTGADRPAQAHAVATSEAIALRSVGPVMITHVVPDPAEYRAGSLGRDLTLTVGWGAVSRIDLEPATCGDPHCEADHGYSGSITGEDLSLRVSAEADGEQALDEAVAFARALSAATVRG
ncbi:MAG: phosphodiesterase [Actinobacteria bacterium 69-20]|nr:phosphodiesterase [Actinomycetota bacterium]OJV25893.1 MAG: phosphodiesterase [Actinobacteria bacterium 69-20]